MVSAVSRKGNAKYSRVGASAAIVVNTPNNS